MRLTRCTSNLVRNAGRCLMSAAEESQLSGEGLIRLHTKCNSPSAKWECMWTLQHSEFIEAVGSDSGSVAQTDPAQVRGRRAPALNMGRHSDGCPCSRPRQAGNVLIRDKAAAVMAGAQTDGGG